MLLERLGFGDRMGEFSSGRLMSDLERVHQYEGINKIKPLY